MSQWIYEYKCTIPLVYNQYDIRTEDEKDSEQRFGLQDDICWTKAYSAELEYEGRVFSHDGEIQFCIQCGEDAHLNMPDREFTLTVSGMISQSRPGAFKLFSDELIYICYVLSIMMNNHNANKQAYQHKVQVDYDRIGWESQAHEPFIEWADLGDRNEIRIIDGKETRVISMRTQPLQMEASSYMYIYQKLNTEEFWDYYREDMNADQKYLVHEYYLAQGTESMTSKLYHLCSMIEYIEKRYTDMAECTPLYLKTQSEELLFQMKELPAFKQLDKNQKNRFISAVSVHLNSATDIGRDEKLCRILWNMGINEIKMFDKMIPIDKKYVHMLTDIRNTYFHGKKTEHQNIDRMIVELMQLGLMIVKWVLKTE